MRRCVGLCLIACLASVPVVGGEPKRVEESENGGLELKVMSFNIRWSSQAEPDRGGKNSWNNRREAVARMISDYGPDVAGLQEAGAWQVDELLERLPGLTAFNRDPDSVVPNVQSLVILYRRDRFRLDRAASASTVTAAEVPAQDWGPGSVRVPMWARLVSEETGQGFYVFNLHHDNRFRESRAWSSALLVRTIRDRAHPEPVIVTGDFNAMEASPSILYLKGYGELSDVGRSPVPLVDSLRVLHPGAVDVGTYHAFRGDDFAEIRKIDSVLIGAGITVLEAEILRSMIDGRYPSDHYPVTARLRLDPVQ